MKLAIIIALWIICSCISFYFLCKTWAIEFKITNKDIVVNLVLSLLIAPLMCPVSICAFITELIEQRIKHLPDNRDWKISKFFNNED